MQVDLLLWLQSWYQSQCDGDWEHCYGIKIETLDNPGWYISIELSETELQDITFETLKIDRSEEDWIFCKVENNKFLGAGGVLNLRELLEIFRRWAITQQD